MLLDLSYDSKINVKNKFDVNVAFDLEKIWDARNKEFSNKQKSIIRYFYALSRWGFGELEASWEAWV